ncbi:hypothetical protein DID88_009767 [Monilinia fructigena]|uniref:CID domain-containing protein n=1 Tax=Monilinia fructigena TaxID=38457 RepID=A0A395IK89_9HELO|nr:hypothetical protein DID88_009767 [Monilinia fructigena]
MAYNDDAVLAKLSALNETQESIVTVAQWIMFHRRYADRTGQLWLQKLKDSGSNKRLNLVYLANEVAQQSKARRKDDFLIAFSPVIAEATATAYKGATSDVQNKLKRVVEVWRQRQIFEAPIQDAVEARIEEDVEDSIMRGFANSNESTPADGSPGNQMTTPKSEPDRPEVEPLSPPLRPAKEEPEQEPLPDYDLNSAAANKWFSLRCPIHVTNLCSVKKRKLNDDFPDMGGDAMEGLDADVAEMLRQDSGGA